MLNVMLFYFRDRFIEQLMKEINELKHELTSLRHDKAEVKISLYLIQRLKIFLLLVVPFLNIFVLDL